jgi:hypothetical protein
MKPQLQKYLYNDGSGQYGDCHRTCIAMILNMDRDDVPHFMADVPYGCVPGDERSKAAEQLENDWLAARNLATVNWGYDGATTTLEQVIEVVCRLARSPVILGCQSQNRCDHSVVLWEGEIYNPNGGEIAGPMKDGFWWITAIAVGPNWGQL